MYGDACLLTFVFLALLSPRSLPLAWRLTRGRCFVPSCVLRPSRVFRVLHCTLQPFWLMLHFHNVGAQ